jgi:hypothetical protein
MMDKNKKSHPDKCKQQRWLDNDSYGMVQYLFDNLEQDLEEFNDRYDQTFAE